MQLLNYRLRSLRIAHLKFKFCFYMWIRVFGCIFYDWFFHLVGAEDFWESLNKHEFSVQSIKAHLQRWKALDYYYLDVYGEPWVINHELSLEAVLIKSMIHPYKKSKFISRKKLLREFEKHSLWL